MTLALADYRLALRARALTLAVATTDGDFARATTATYVDADGVVQTAAIDEPRHAHYVAGVGPSSLYEAAATNLVLRSDEFDHARWSKSATGAATAPAVTANATAAPDGTTTADEVVFIAPGAGDNSSLTQAGIVTVAASVYTGSLWIRAAAAGDVGKIVLFRHVAASSYASVTLSATWTRIARTETAAGTSSSLSVDLRPSLGSSTGTVTVHLWRGQLELGSSATSEIQTTGTTATRAADTGGATLAATGSTYTRAAGSFITDGFRVGMEVTPVGFSDLTRRTIRQVTALTLTVDSAPTAQTVTTGRALLVGMPATRTYENVDAAASIVQPAPWTAETLLPGTLVQDTIGPLGWMEQTAIYQWTFHVTADAGPSALDRYADAMMVHLAPRLALTTDDGTVVRVRSDVGVQRSPVLPSDTAGYASVSVSFPVRVRTPNTL